MNKSVRFQSPKFSNEFGNKSPQYALSNSPPKFKLKSSIISEYFQGTQDKNTRWNNCGNSENRTDEFKVLYLHLKSDKSFTINLKFYPVNPFDNKFAVDHKVKFEK